jgi:hypothetical protein
VLVGCIVVGVIGLGVVGLVVLGVPWEKTAEDLPVGESDRSAVVTIDRIAEWMGHWPVDPRNESWAKRRFVDGSWEVEYTYESGDETEDGLYLQSSLSVEPKLSDARMGYGVLAAAMRASLGLLAGDGIEVRERPDLVDWGEQRTSLLLVGAEGPSGNLVVARSGRRLVLYLCVGLYFDEAEPFREFLAPVLAAAETHEP